jgi:hypothetical protein
MGPQNISCNIAQGFCLPGMVDFSVAVRTVGCLARLHIV